MALLPTFSASNIVVGSVVFAVSGNVSTNTPEMIAQDPNRIKGNAGKISACGREEGSADAS